MSSDEGLADDSKDLIGTGRKGKERTWHRAASAAIFFAGFLLVGAFFLCSTGPAALHQQQAETRQLVVPAPDPAPKTNGTQQLVEGVWDKLPVGLEPKLWCLGPVPPKLWKVEASGKPLLIKVLSYNLFWWNLYIKRGGNGDSASKVIKASMEDTPYDVMGFQECRDPWKVLSAAGLLEQYDVFHGKYDTCMAYRKADWKVLSHGLTDVAEDMPKNYYGKRGALWMRLQHRLTGRKLFFVNHHGPLSVNSGGICGGQATAHNLVRTMTDNAEPGDAIILTGDFNANAASLTLRTLKKYLMQVFNGNVFGGIDNILSNIEDDGIVATKRLGKGGSDHNAINAVIALGKMSNVNGLSPDWTLPWRVMGNNGFDDKKFWCGRMEFGVNYEISDGWSKTVENVKKPDRCCLLCQMDKRCKAWAFKQGPPAPPHPGMDWHMLQGKAFPGPCWLKGLVPQHGQRKWEAGLVAGLPYR
eukprot:CAMPEP_0172809436 /NCGR_PEP_ID=MMETSP1075-20121228/8227_1 /TAXON_ID=2916 /ORGANISM="Ceratium fusus, Strain PA161109" /LENGTH=470 /DNA_ID=CAMNT_0013648651 /DNA_START=48 /DNA_END=1460 /DNA_ORIENTATION=+